MDPSTIRSALDRLLADPEFRVSDRNKSFLRFVVEETLAGRAERIKSYTIAVDVFGRDASFDGASDPIVRIEASRLRAGLDAYYADPDRPLDIRFNLPKGGYVPSFESQAAGAVDGETAEAAAADDPAPATAAPAAGRRRIWPERWSRRVLALAAAAALAALAVAVFVATRPSAPQLPVLVINPVDALTSDEPTQTLARTLGKSLDVALGQYEGLRVVLAAPGDSRVAELAADGRTLFLLNTSVRIEGDKVQLWWQLINSQTLEVLWSTTTSGPWPPPGGQLVELDIAAKVASLIAYRNGLLNAYQTREMQMPPPAGYDCVVWTRGFNLRMNARNHAIARDCLEETVKGNPDYALAWAFLANTYVEEVRSGFNLRDSREDAMARAQTAAKRALTLAPYSAYSHIAAAAVAFQNRDRQTFMTEMHRAVELSPNDPAILMYAGVRVFAQGDWDEGVALVQRSLNLTGQPPPIDYITFAINHYRKGEYAKAIALLDDIPTRDFYPIPMYTAAAYSELGDLDKARLYVAKLRELDPEIAAKLRDDLRQRQYPEAFIDRIAAALGKAGLPLR